jgi:sensitive to high expression protein 9
MYEQTEAKAKERAAESDAQVDQELNELLRSILSRYHEEQIWSDKIRSASTYGSLAALGLNLLVFVMATLVVEPWKRNRLAQTFEKKVEELSAQTREMIETEMQLVHQRMDQTLALPPRPSPQVIVVDENRSLLERLKNDVELQILLGAVIAGWIVNIFQ